MLAARKGKQGKKREKTAKYIEASALPVRNGAGKVRKREQGKQPLQRTASKDEKH